MVVVIVCAAVYRQHAIVAHMIKIKVNTLTAYRSANIADMIHYIVHRTLAEGGAADVTEVILVVVIALLLATGAKEQGKDGNYHYTANLFAKVHK